MSLSGSSWRTCSKADPHDLPHFFKLPGFHASLEFLHPDSRETGFPPSCTGNRPIVSFQRFLGFWFLNSDVSDDDEDVLLLARKVAAELTLAAMLRRSMTGRYMGQMHFAERCHHFQKCPR